MTTITRFEIKKLHGYKNIDLRLDDNTVILVGENGAGKTTILHLFYYLLSGQWSSIARFQFEEIAMTIGNKRHAIKHSEFTKPLRKTV
jgi:recombinational DNA repair ATPase RecF